MRILLVEDSPGDADLVCEYLASERDLAQETPMEVTIATRLSEALKRLTERTFDACLLDLGLPDATGLQGVHRLGEDARGLPLVVLTGVDDAQLSLGAMQAGAQDYLVKGQFDQRLLRRSLRYAVERRRAGALYEELLKNSPDCTIIVDARGVVMLANPAARRLLGRQNLVGTHFGFPVVDGESTELDLPQGRIAEMRVSSLLWKGDHACLATLRDVTDQRLLQERVRRAEKMEAIGQLAAGVAHEINSPLQYVSDNTAFLHHAFEKQQGFIQRLREIRTRLAARRQSGAINDEPLTEAVDALNEAEEQADMEFLAEEVPQALQSMVEGVDQVSTIVHSLKSFTHPGQRSASLCDINEGVRTVLVLSTHECKGVADVQTDLGELPPVCCHAGELNQALLNLIVNSAHAIADKQRKHGSDQRGRIFVRTSRQGDEVVIEVADTGCGIPKSVADRVFDLFFTTKEAGRGTGQGLAIAHRIVTQGHGGRLYFETVPEEGTTFFIRLPIAGVAAAGS